MTLYISDYLDLIEEVEASHRLSPGEEEFIASLQEKYDEYGAGAFISEAQIAWLERIRDR